MVGGGDIMWISPPHIYPPLAWGTPPPLFRGIPPPPCHNVILGGIIPYVNQRKFSGKFRYLSYMETMITKFMNSFKLEFEITLVSNDRFLFGRRLYCFKSSVYNKEDYELLLYTCWSKKHNSNIIKFDGSTWEKSASGGIFSFLGENDEVDEYFLSLTKKYCTEYILNREQD